LLLLGEFREPEMHTVEPVAREPSFSGDVIAKRHSERLSPGCTLVPGVAGHVFEVWKTKVMHTEFYHGNILESVQLNKKFYFPSTRHGPNRKRGVQQFFIVSCVFVA
jgi:hypothetical protein